MRDFNYELKELCRHNGDGSYAPSFKPHFTSAGLAYFNPHSFRNTLVRLGQAVCKTPEEFKAWSKNSGMTKC
jgi:hypothetical protein